VCALGSENGEMLGPQSIWSMWHGVRNTDRRQFACSRLWRRLCANADGTRRLSHVHIVRNCDGDMFRAQLRRTIGHWQHHQHWHAKHADRHRFGNVLCAAPNLRWIPSFVCGVDRRCGEMLGLEQRRTTRTRIRERRWSRITQCRSSGRPDGR